MTFYDEFSWERPRPAVLMIPGNFLFTPWWAKPKLLPAIFDIGDSSVVCRLLRRSTGERDNSRRKSAITPVAGASPCLFAISLDSIQRIAAIVVKFLVMTPILILVAVVVVLMPAFAEGFLLGGTRIYNPLNFRKVYSLNAEEASNDNDKDAVSNSSGDVPAQLYSRECDAILPVVKDTMSLYFSDIEKTNPVAFDRLAREVSSDLADGSGSRDAAYKLISSTMRHLVSGGTERIWASTFMKLLASAIVDGHSDTAGDTLIELQLVLERSGLATFFEGSGHRKLLKSEIPFLLEPALRNDEVFPGKMPPPLTKKLFNVPVARFKTIDDIANIPDGYYGIPTRDQFPLIDAVVQPDILLQFTYWPDKHRGTTTQLLADIRKCLHEKDPAKHKMVFVVPRESSIDQPFGYHSDLSEINQFLCCVDN